MPIVPTSANPRPSVGDVLNVARARVNDMINDVDGDLLTNDAPYTQTYLSAAWRWYQDRCADAGVEALIREVFLFSLPVQASQDTAYPAYITWEGCSDGVNQYDAPALPSDLIQPLSVWQRTSSTYAGQFCLMGQATDGLPTWLDYSVYDWRDEGLYFFANSQTQDMRIRYSAYRNDLIALNPTDQVPMMRCEDALGARVAFEFASARGATQAPALMQWAEDAFQNGAAQRTSRRKQRQSLRRMGYSRRYNTGWSWPVHGN